MKSGERERERERERTCRILPLLCFHLFIRGPPPPLTSLYSRFYSPSILPLFIRNSPPLHDHTTHSFFPAFIFCVALFGALLQKIDRPTDRPTDRTAPASRTMKNIALAEPIFNYYARSERFSFRTRKRR
jgi:hypothetical protein